MIYLEELNRVTEEKYSIGFIHYRPFDPKVGLGKTKEELEKTGILLESIPDPQSIKGKYPKMYWNPIKKEIFYEYEDIPKTQEEVLQNRVEALEKSNAELMNLIMMQNITPNK